MNVNIIKILTLNLLIIFSTTKSMDWYDEIEDRQKQAKLNHPLFSNSLFGSVEKVQELIDKDANVNFRYVDPAEALKEFANVIKNCERSEKGLAPLSPVSSSPRLIQTPLSNAVIGANLDVVKCLLYNDAWIMECTSLDDKECTILELAQQCLDQKLKKYNKTEESNRLCKVNESIQIVNFLKKHTARMQKVKKYDYFARWKDIVKRVNNILQESPHYLGLLKNRIKNHLSTLPLIEDLKNIIIEYHNVSYPEDSQEFFKLSDEAIDEMTDIYIQEIENKKSEACKISGKRKLENIDS